MKRKIYLCLLVSFLLFCIIFTSCNDNANDEKNLKKGNERSVTLESHLHESYVVNEKKSGGNIETERTIEPEDGKGVDLDYYVFSFIGGVYDEENPLEKKFSRSDDGRYLIDGLTPGEYNVSVSGYDKYENKISESTTKNVHLLDGKANIINININSLYGKGKLSLTFTWKNTEDSIIRRNIVVTIFDFDKKVVFSSEVDGDLIYPNGKNEALLNIPAMDAGSYFISVRINGNDGRNYGKEDSIRIGNGAISSSEISLSLNGNYDVTSFVQDNTSSPLSGTIVPTHLGNHYFRFDLEWNNLSPNVSESDIVTKWYIDGVEYQLEKIKNQYFRSSCQITAIYYIKDVLGSVGSSSYDFDITKF